MLGRAEDTQRAEGEPRAACPGLCASEADSSKGRTQAAQACRARPPSSTPAAHLLGDILSDERVGRLL